MRRESLALVAIDEPCLAGGDVRAFGPGIRLQALHDAAFVRSGGGVGAGGVSGRDAVAQPLIGKSSFGSTRLAFEFPTDRDAVGRDHFLRGEIVAAYVDSLALIKGRGSPEGNFDTVLGRSQELGSSRGRGAVRE